MKKKIYLLIIVALLGVFISSCKKDEETAPVAAIDQRDQWIGTYIGETTGSLSFSILGQSTPIALSGPASFEIQKGSNINEILMIDNAETVRGVISGNSVTFDALTRDQVIDDFTMQLTANTTGTLSGSAFNYEMIITGRGEYLGIGFPVEGEATCMTMRQ